MKRKILIISKTGKEYYRSAEIVDYIDNEGNQFSRAYAGKSVYKIVERRFEGPLWSVCNTKTEV